MSNEVKMRTFQPRERYREVQAFIYQAGMRIPQLVEPTEFQNGPGATVISSRGKLWAIPGDVIVLMADNTFDVMKPGDFFQYWQEEKP